MTTILRIDPPLPVLVDDRKALAYFLRDPGLYWTVCFEDSDQLWTVDNPRVRLRETFTRGPMPMARPPQSDKGPFVPAVEPWHLNRRTDTPEYRLEQARDEIARLGGVELNLTAEVASLTGELSKADAEIARLKAELALAQARAERALVCDLCRADHNDIRAIKGHLKALFDFTMDH